MAIFTAFIIRNHWPMRRHMIQYSKLTILFNLLVDKTGQLRRDNNIFDAKSVWRPIRCITKDYDCYEDIWKPQCLHKLIQYQYMLDSDNIIGEMLRITHDEPATIRNILHLGMYIGQWNVVNRYKEAGTSNLCNYIDISTIMSLSDRLGENDFYVLNKYMNDLI